MKSPSFLEGALLALIAALAGTLIYSALAWALPADSALRLVVAGLGIGYLLYLLGRSAERVGRVTILSLWLTLSALLWLLVPPLPLYLAAHLAMGWAGRSLYFHQSLLGALADLGLTGLGLIAALGAYLHTGSLLLSLWSLFLVQALFVFIPSRASRLDDSLDGNEDGFRRAHQAAQAAVHRLSSMS